jgi:hypothetical protein
MLLGTALALAALAFVLYPLFREPLALGPARPRSFAHDQTNSAVDALREIEFDHVTGKLSEHDYAELKATYTQRAVTAMRGTEVAVVICDVCGPRPESDAVFCSNCGRSLI